MIPQLNDSAQNLCQNLIECMEEKSVETLFKKITGVQKAIFLMILHLCCPDLRTECESISEIPLAGFNTLTRIQEYARNIMEFGVSTETRGRIFILGNTGTGKTSLARTLKNKDMQSFLTGDPANKHLEKTKILEIHPDLKLKTILKEMVQEPSREGNGARAFVKICPKRGSEIILEQAGAEKCQGQVQLGKLDNLKSS